MMNLENARVVIKQALKRGVLRAEEANDIFTRKCEGRCANSANCGVLRRMAEENSIEPLLYAHSPQAQIMGALINSFLEKLEGRLDGLAAGYPEGNGTKGKSLADVLAEAEDKMGLNENEK